MEKSGFLAAMETWRVPERIIFVTSLSRDGEPHIISVSWKMRCSFDPPMFAIAIGKERFMRSCIRESGEFVISVPGEDLAGLVLDVGRPSQSPVNRFEKYNIRTQTAAVTKSPLIAGCLANFECMVENSLDTGDHTIFVGRVVQSWIGDKQKRNLSLVSSDAGYDVLAEDPPYTVGVVKK